MQTSGDEALPRRRGDVNASRHDVGGAGWTEWSNGPHDTYGEHAHSYRKLLVCVSGSIEFRLADGETIRLGPGDRMELDAGTRHSAVVGPHGCTCVEGKA